MRGEFHTTDVDLAAWLRYRDIRYLRLATNPSNASLTDFIFPESDDLYAALREWAAEGEGCYVDAREFGRLRRKLFRTAKNFPSREN